MGSELWQRIREARTRAGITQDAVAAACGIRRNAVSLWETKKSENRTKPSTENLRKFAALVSEHTRASVSDVSGWLLSDGTDITSPFDAGAETTGITPPPNPPSGPSDAATRLIEIFEQMTPAIKIRVLGLVQTLATDADSDGTPGADDQNKHTELAPNSAPAKGTIERKFGPSTLNSLKRRGKSGDVAE